MAERMTRDEPAPTFVFHDIEGDIEFTVGGEYIDTEGYLWTVVAFTPAGVPLLCWTHNLGQDGDPMSGQLLHLLHEAQDAFGPLLPAPGRAV